VVLLVAFSAADAFAFDETKYNTLTYPAPAPLKALSLLTPGTEAPVSSQDWKGKVVVLNFWATWCGPCVKEMPSLNALAKSYEGKNVLVIPASQDVTGFITIKAFYRRHKLDHLPVYWDKGFTAFKTLGLSVVPVSLVIDRQGMIIGWVEGVIDWDGPEVHALIDKALATP